MTPIQFLVYNSWYFIVFALTSFLLYVREDNLKNSHKIQKEKCESACNYNFIPEAIYYKFWCFVYDALIFVSDKKILIVSTILALASVILNKGN